MVTNRNWPCPVGKVLNCWTRFRVFDPCRSGFICILKNSGKLHFNANFFALSLLNLFRVPVSVPVRCSHSRSEFPFPVPASRFPFTLAFPFPFRRCAHAPMRSCAHAPMGFKARTKFKFLCALNQSTEKFGPKLNYSATWQRGEFLLSWVRGRDKSSFFAPKIGYRWCWIQR